MNSETGAVHECFAACDARVEVGERVVCSLTSTVLGTTQSVWTAEAVAPRRVGRDVVDVARAKSSSELASRRRIARAVVDALFTSEFECEAPPAARDAYVDACVRAHAWLGENIAFEAVTYATLMCMAEGVDTGTLRARADEALGRRILPLRNVERALSIKPKAVTRAYTALVRKRGDELRI